MGLEKYGTKKYGTGFETWSESKSKYRKSKVWEKKVLDTPQKSPISPMPFPFHTFAGTVGG